MAKKALVHKAAKKPKFAVRGYTRCQRCGRPHAVFRKFGLCRICLREMAHAGELPGVRKSIAQFKLREGMPIGAHVTLRGDRMWEFLDRLLTLALPRIRDFRGLSPKQFDGRGNYTFGLTEQVMFHEVDQDRIDRTSGMDITVVTTATNDDEGRALLKQLGFHFAER